MKLLPPAATLTVKLVHQSLQPQAPRPLPCRCLPPNPQNRCPYPSPSIRLHPEPVLPHSMDGALSELGPMQARLDAGPAMKKTDKALDMIGTPFHLSEYRILRLADYGYDYGYGCEQGFSHVSRESLFGIRVRVNAARASASLASPSPSSYYLPPPHASFFVLNI